MRVCTLCRSLLAADAVQCPADQAAAEPVAVLPAGTRIGGYRIERMLGEGGMGFVYQATHQQLGGRWAIKLLRPELAGQVHIATRFLNEARAVNLIGHQNVVNIYHYGDDLPGSVYFVMEFLDGETLDELMRRRRPMAVPLVLHVFGQLARVLAAAHDKQIVHRDLKPANVYVIAREGNPYFVKLLDFGIAQLRGAGAVPGLTLAGSVLGTPQYMSPEQISGGVVDARSDVWAMGVMLYRAATGYAPFTGEAFGELADKILHHPPRPAAELAAVPPALSALIASCLERRAEDRCPSAAQLIAGLARVKREAGLDDDAVLAAVKAGPGAAVEARPASRRDPTRDSMAGSLPHFQGAPHPVATPDPPARPRRSRRVRWVAVGAAVAALGVAGSLVASRRVDLPAGSVADAAVGRSVERPAERPGTPVVAEAPVANQSVERPGDPPGEPPIAQPGRRSIEQAFLSGDTAAARALAEHDLRAALGSTSLQQRGFAVEALGRARTPATAPLLYAALSGAPEIRKKAADALGNLALPDAIPRLRTAFGEAGDRSRVDLAAAMFRIGDHDARAPLIRALRDPTQAQSAAIAMAMAEPADPAGRAVLADALAVNSPGSAAWQRAAGGLLRLGDAGARRLLTGELSRPDPERSIPAAEALARAGDRAARELLARVTADAGAAGRGQAAEALARLGDRRGLGWLGDGLASADAENRLRALAICGALAPDAASWTGAVARLASGDPDPQVRLTAEAVLLSL